MMQIETLLKARYQAITQRLRNPKGGIVESKIVRLKEEFITAPPKPKREEVHSKIDSVTLDQIREDYADGIAIERICARFHIAHRTVRALRQRHGWPVRERIKPRARRE